MDDKQAVDATDRSSSSSPPKRVASHDERRHAAGVRDKDLDRAFKYLEGREDAATDAEDVNIKALKRKIDWRIVPIMFACYTMQFVDKVLLNVRLPAFFSSCLSPSLLGSSCGRTSNLRARSDPCP